MSTLLTTEIGLERIERQAILVLMAGLNDEIISQRSNWQTLDQELAQIQQLPYIPAIPEVVDLPNFVQGHRPSLILAPQDQYPNVAAICARSISAPEQFDQFDMYQMTLKFEIFVKALESEDIVNKRIKRTAEALNNVIAENKTLDGLIQPIQKPPEVLITDCFVRAGDPETSAQDWFWQAARLTYEITKPSVF